jgi:hypothetical protein
MYLANCTRPDITFAMNLLARQCRSNSPSLNGREAYPQNLNGTNDLGLFLKKNYDPNMIGYTDAGYLSGPHNDQSQIGFVFLHGGTTISWKYSKQTLTVTSTNHSKIIALYKASHECV